MFDANKGAQVSQARIEAMSDQLATDAVNYLENPSVSRSEKEAAIKAATAIFADPEALKSLASGQFAQNSAGQPALQLGSGNRTPDLQEIAQLIKSVAVNQDQAQAAMRFLLPPSDASFLEASRGGVPAEVYTLERELDEANRKIDLANDPNNVGSLAEKAKTAETARNVAEEAKAEAVTKQKAAENSLKALQKDVIPKEDVRKIYEELVKSNQFLGKAKTDESLNKLFELVKPAS